MKIENTNHQTCGFFNLNKTIKITHFDTEWSEKKRKMEITETA